MGFLIKRFKIFLVYEKALTFIIYFPKICWLMTKQVGKYQGIAIFNLFETLATPFHENITIKQTI